MPSHTHYIWFETKRRQEIIDITDEVDAELRKSGIREGFALVSAMHISASVFVVTSCAIPPCGHITVLAIVRIGITAAPRTTWRRSRGSRPRARP